jgi:hypothetical protein
MRIGSIAVFALLGLGACARGPNVTTDVLPLKRVVVYRNGVGYFERTGHVTRDRVRFQMRQRMVGDFLATLAIVERGGSSVRAASFPLEMEDEEVESDRAETTSESLLKPWPKPAKKDPAKRMRDVVLSLDGREHDLAIGYVVETPVWKPSYRVVVRKDGSADLQAWGIVQNLSGEDWRNVELTLVAGAPLAFESTLGEAVVPERPIVTDTGEVIAAVPEGVTSLKEKAQGTVQRVGFEAPKQAEALEKPSVRGNKSDEESDADEETEKKPVTRSRSSGKAAADMKTSPARPVSKPPAAAPAAQPVGTPAPQARDERRRLALEDAQRQGLSAPRNLSALAAVAVETGATRYAIPGTTTVPDKSATMVLLMNLRVPGEAVLLFAPDSGVADSAMHPFRVVRFTNRSTGLLERGPIAVFELGSFLGQGIVEPLPPGAQATVPFALERSLGVDTERRQSEEGARLHKIEAGELWIERDIVQKTIYKIKNGSDERSKLLVKHLRAPETRLYHPPPGTEDNTGQRHALVPLEVAAHGRAELQVDERRAAPQPASWLSPLADLAIRGYLGDTRADRDLAKRLGDAWQVREVWKRADDERQKLAVEERQVNQAAGETRASLKAIEKNAQAADLRQRLTGRLREVTLRQEQITKRLVELGMAISESEVRFRDAIRELRLLEPLPPRRDS